MRCGPVHPTSPFSFCLRRWVNQCARCCCPPHSAKSYIANASQMLIGALLRRYGVGSLAHRAGGPVASSVTMRPFLSRAFVKKSHIVTFASSEGWLCQSAAKTEYRPCRVTPNESRCFAGLQSERRSAGCVSRIACASRLAS